MKIAVVGSRNWKNREFIEQVIKSLFLEYHEDIFVSGGASGVDIIAEEYIDHLNSFFELDPKIEKIIFNPDWVKFGKKAGVIRNQQIVDTADIIIAFWDGKSKGTKITIDMAIASGKPCDIYIRS